MKWLMLLMMGLSAANAALNVVASYPYIGELTQKIGGDGVKVEVLAQGNWDPHFVIPKPSLVTKLRNADLIIFNGADLEIGWLPPLLERSANRQLSQPSHRLELASKVKMIDVPSNISRAGGDIHADGNPHFHLDPRNIPILAEAIFVFLSQNDPSHTENYKNNLKRFKLDWNGNLKRWESQMAPFRGKGVVQYHPVFSYFLNAYGLKTVGTIEPLPGIPPSSAHTMKLIKIIADERPLCVFHDVYHPFKTAEFLKDKTGIELVKMPHDVGSTKEATDLESLFDALVKGIR